MFHNKSHKRNLNSTIVIQIQATLLMITNSCCVAREGRIIYNGFYRENKEVGELFEND